MQMSAFKDIMAKSSSLHSDAIKDAFDAQRLVENFEQLCRAHGGVEQVRRLLVELAIRGRLTAAETGDDDVQALLVRIAREVGDRAAKYPAVGSNDEPFAIPARWTWVRWGHLAIGTNSGWSPQCENRPRGDQEWGVLKVSAVSWNHFKPGENKALPKGVEPRLEFAARAGDFLMSRANTAELVGRCVIVMDRPERLLLSDKIVRCEFSSHVEKAYIALYNRSSAARSHYVAQASGTSDSMKNISRDVILAMPVPLPPLAEQKRIVAKVDKLMALCEELEGRQNKAREVGTRLTKSALEALTTAEGPEEFDIAWKRVNGNFDVLFDRSEKVGELGKAVLELAVRGHFVGASKDDGAVPDFVTAEEAPFALPDGWRWGRLESLASHVVDCLHSTPQYVAVGVPAIRTADVVPGRLLLDGARLVDEAQFCERISRLAPREGDIFYSREGERLGIAACVPTGVRVCLAQRMMHIRVRAPLDPRYVMWAMNSQWVYRQAVGDTGGSTSPHINLRDIRRFLVPVPPPGQQPRIVAVIESLTTVCDELQERLVRAEERAGKLVAAIVSEIVA